MKLTVNDINTLIEALDAWTSSSMTASMLGGLIFGSLLASDGSGTKDPKDFFEKFNEGEEEKKKSREETATILKAKLIEMRNKLMIDEVENELNRFIEQ